MAEYDADSSQYTQSLGCGMVLWSQQNMDAIKKHHQTTNKKYLYLSGWMVCCFAFRILEPLPDQSMHEKNGRFLHWLKRFTSFLRQLMPIELNDLFRRLENGEDVYKSNGQFRKRIVVPIIAEHWCWILEMKKPHYLWPNKWLSSWRLFAIQLENPVSDAKQCGHQDEKLTVPHERFLLLK